MASIIFPGIFLVLCNYCPFSTNSYSASLILLITHSGFTFLLHILLFDSTDITFRIHLPCSIYHFIWPSAIKRTPWVLKEKEVFNNNWTPRKGKPPSAETLKTLSKLLGRSTNMIRSRADYMMKGKIKGEKFNWLHSIRIDLL